VGCSLLLPLRRRQISQGSRSCRTPCRDICKGHKWSSEKSLSPVLYHRSLYHGYFCAQTLRWATQTWFPFGVAPVPFSYVTQAGILHRVGPPPMPSRPVNHSDHCPMSFQGPVAQRSRPRLPHPSPRVTRGHHLPPQVQLAETEAFSLNSDRSSSVLLGDDLSLEDPTACPQGPKESKVSS
jgi:hypothetical protein